MALVLARLPHYQTGLMQSDVGRISVLDRPLLIGLDRTWYLKIAFLDNALRKLRGKRKVTPTKVLFDTLSGFGLKADHIVDVGANHGDWTREALQHYPQARVTMFEPQKKLAEYHIDLAGNPKIDLHYCGLGDRDGTQTFTLHDRDDSSSFVYSEEEARDHGYTQIEIDIRKLDTVLKSSAFGAPQIVKIDAEGFDLQVLKGANQTLKTAEVVLVEAAVCNPTYDNTVLEVVKAMDKLGMTLWSITDLNRTPNRKILWLIEAVFVPKGGMLHRAAQTYD
ncbi:MAG: FkbM family methyltransferase [Pseudomonadota bacterium]